MPLTFTRGKIEYGTIYSLSPMIEQIRPFLSAQDQKKISLHVSTLKGKKMLSIQFDKKKWSIFLDPEEKEKQSTFDIPLTPLEILESIIN
jgi:hypothetical protein